MAKKKEYQIVVKANTQVGFTQEMIDWLIAHGKKVNDSIRYHDPIFVQCINEVKPNGWEVYTIKGSKYRILEVGDNFLVVTPEDIKALNRSMVDIEAPEVKSEITKENGN